MKNVNVIMCLLLFTLCIKATPDSGNKNDGLWVNPADLAKILSDLNNRSMQAIQGSTKPGQQALKLSIVSLLCGTEATPSKCSISYLLN